MIEQWTPAPGFEFDYEVSSDGHVRRIAVGKWRHNRIVKPYRRKDGYLTVGLYQSGRQRTTYLHRLVCEAFHGPCPPMAQHAAHENGINDDDRAENLSWKSVPANLEDKRRHGTHLQGVTHPAARLNEAAVLEVFRLRRSGLTLKEIGGAMGIHLSHVSDILKRKVWASIDVPSDLLEAAS